VFSFIKAMQNLLSELKKRKGLWFTTISIISVLGIMVSMYLLTAITSNIAKEVYENMAVSYKHTLELELEDKQREFSKLVVGLKTNDNFKNNLNDKQVIDSIIENYNKNLISSDFTSITVSFYSTINQSTQYRNSVNTAANRKTPSFGIEVISEGPFVVYLEPIIVGDNILGIVEVKESILSLKKEFERNGHSIFLFLIQEKMMSNLAVNAKNGKYRSIVDDLRVEEEKYDGKFFSNIIEDESEGFKEFKSEGYRVNEDFFRTLKEISDINGVNIGYIIVGEKVEGEGAFVKIVDEMTKSVTLISLGLIIAVLLFMF
jgi:hypothetical protein